MSDVAAPGPRAEAPPEARLSRRARVAVIVVVSAAVAIRLLYLWAIPWHDGGLITIDPDGYTVNGETLARRHFAWPALFRTVAVYQFVRPPLYTIAMALASRLPAPYPLDAAVLQALLGGAMVFAMFWIGYRVHSARAGLIAACLGAIYWPFATTANAFVQESLYIPLATIALASLVEAAARPDNLRVWAVAGALFGLAALTRSMPIYYLPPALALQVWRDGDRRRALRGAGACLLAFALLVTPYSIAISRHAHQLVLVENMGGIIFPMRYPEAREALHHTAPPPTVVETAGMLLRAFTSHPFRFTRERLGDAMMLVWLRGGRTVQLLEGMRTATEALVYKILIDIFDDGLFAVVCVLAPFGWALARHRREAALVGCWILLNVALLAAFTFTGARYRMPSVPSSMVFAAVVLAGGWKVRSKAGIAAAAVVSVAVGWTIARSVPSLLAGRAEYGIHDSRDDGVTRLVSSIGGVGLDVLPYAGSVTATVSLAASGPPGRIDLRLNDVPLESWTMEPGGARTLRYVWPRPEIVYLEMRVSDSSGRPEPFVVEVPIGAPPHVR